MADQIIYNEQMKLKEKKSKYFCEKYPKRRRPAEQHNIDAGITYFNDALADTSYSARRFRAPMEYAGGGPVDELVMKRSIKNLKTRLISALGETIRRKLIPSRVRKRLTVWAPTRKSFEQWSDDFKQGHTVTRVNLENDDAFSFFVEPSVSGNDVVLDKARHDDEDDEDEYTNHISFFSMRTSLMTCLRLLVEFRWYLCRTEIPSEEARTVLPE